MSSAAWSTLREGVLKTGDLEAVQRHRELVPGKHVIPLVVHAGVDGLLTDESIHLLLEVRVGDLVANLKAIAEK